VAEGEAAAAATSSAADTARAGREFAGTHAVNDTIVVQEVEPGSWSRLEGIAKEGESQSEWDASFGGRDFQGQRFS
jgi:hypothetical protein